jgi:hypothetical protein
VKNFILVLFFVLTTCSTPAYSQDNKTLEYPSLYIAQWVYQCSQALYPMYMNNGAPQPYAINLAAQSCSCVIDEFRKHFLWLEVQTMSKEDRALFTENYAVGCSPYGRSL